MLPRRSPDANADGILRGGNIMIKVKNTGFGRSKTDPSKRWKWSISVDDPLDALLNAVDIEDADSQMMVCEALCRIGLAECRLFGEDTDTLESDEYVYTSTKTMQKLVRKWQP
jgi:hypothetical protein